MRFGFSVRRPEADLAALRFLPIFSILAAKRALPGHASGHAEPLTMQHQHGACDAVNPNVTEVSER